MMVPEWVLRLGAPVLRIFAVGSACLMLSACTFLQSKSGLGPTDVPFSWVQTTPTSEKVWPDAGWWSEFGSAELTGLVAEAQASNLDLVIARARVEQADAQARIVGSSLLPTISARGGADENGSLETAAGKVRTLSANVNVSYELDFWGRNAASARAADLSLRSSVYDQETVALTTIASVASTYFELLSLRDRWRLARLNAANAEKVLVLTEKQFAAGTISKLPVMQQHMKNNIFRHAHGEVRIVDTHDGHAIRQRRVLEDGIDTRTQREDHLETRQRAHHIRRRQPCRHIVHRGNVARLGPHPHLHARRRLAHLGSPQLAVPGGRHEQKRAHCLTAPSLALRLKAAASSALV